MSAEWARAALVSLGCRQSGFIPRLLRSRLCRWKMRSSLALSFIFPPPQVLTALAASASLGSNAETSTAPTVANTTAATTTMACLKTMEAPLLQDAEAHATPSPARSQAHQRGEVGTHKAYYKRIFGPESGRDVQGGVL